VLGVLGRLDTPAVSNARLGFIDDPLARIPSTSLAQFAADVAKALGEFPPEPQSNF